MRTPALILCALTVALVALSATTASARPWPGRTGIGNHAPENLSDVHDFRAQRSYDVVCMGYGSADAKLYADVVERGLLPWTRTPDGRTMIPLL